MLTIFISHSSKDNNLTKTIRDKLQAWDYDTWVDFDNIPFGTYWPDEIENALQGADVVLGIATPTSVSSLMVRSEWHRAQDKGKPLLLLRAHQNTDFPYPFNTINYIDLVQDERDGYRRLARELNQPRTHFKDEKPVKPPDSKRLQPTKKELTDRNQMLQKVHDYWVTGVLDKIMKEDVSFSIDLSLTPNLVLKHQDYDDYTLPENSTSVFQVFQDMNRELLILGDPGSGKTVLLLQLAQKLIEEAQQTINWPIPVILNLSSWNGQKSNFEEWLLLELTALYRVKKRTARRWIEYEDLCLLLDGLDEVSDLVIDECVRVINQFRQSHPAIDMVICSRLNDYNNLTNRLDLHGAIYLESLSTKQTSDYFSKHAINILELSQSDKVMQQLLVSPFIVGLSLNAYRNHSLNQMRLPEEHNNQPTRLHHIFDNYLVNMFRNVKYDSSYSSRNFRNYVERIANHLRVVGDVMIFVEQLQPWFLETRRNIIIYNIISSFISSIFIGFSYSIAFLDFNNMFVPAFVSFFLVLFFSQPQILLFDNLFWQPNLRRLPKAIISGVVIFLFISLFFLGPMIMPSIPSLILVGAILGVTFTLLEEYIDTQRKMALRPKLNITLLYAARFGLLCGTIFQVTLSVIQGDLLFNFGPTTPIFASLIASGLLAILTLGANRKRRKHFLDEGRRMSGLGDSQFGGYVLLWLFLGATLSSSPYPGIGMALLSGLLFGRGIEVIRYVCLRLLIPLLRVGPWNFRSFLSFATNIGICRKVGPDYIFRHRLFIDYFYQSYRAKLETSLKR